MWADLIIRMELGLGELAAVRDQMSPLISRTSEADLPVIETAAACAMLHAFYTEVGKILKIIAAEFDENLPSSESWHRDLLNQMARPTTSRPAVITPTLVVSLADLLAFRHLFRGASIALMRWNKLAPLVAGVDSVHREVAKQPDDFVNFLRTG